MLAVASSKLYKKYDTAKYPHDGILMLSVGIGFCAVIALLGALCWIPSIISTTAAIRFPEIAAAKEIISAATGIVT